MLGYLNPWLSRFHGGLEPAVWLHGSVVASQVCVHLTRGRQDQTCTQRKRMLQHRLPFDHWRVDQNRLSQRAPDPSVWDVIAVSWVLITPSSSRKSLLQEMKKKGPGRAARRNVQITLSPQDWAPKDGLCQQRIARNCHRPDPFI